MQNSWRLGERHKQSFSARGAEALSGRVLLMGTAMTWFRNDALAPAGM